MTVTTFVVAAIHNYPPMVLVVGMIKVEIPSHLQGEQWTRMPKPKQRLCGLSRTTILELSDAGLIRTVAIRKPGAVKGIRLVFTPSLYAYLDSLAPEAAPAPCADVCTPR
jgi:hypothetical protein